MIQGIDFDRVRVLAEALQRHLLESPSFGDKHFIFKDVLEPVKADSDGWGVTVARISRPRLKVQCWVERSWRTTERHIWAGLASSGFKPLAGVLSSTAPFLTPTMYLYDDDTEALGRDIWGFRSRVEKPRTDDLVLEEYNDDNCFLGFYRFDDDAEGLVDSVAEMIEVVFDALHGDEVEKSLEETQREAVVLARKGQGLYRSNLAQLEKHCRLTGVTEPRLLVASHMKPWSRCENNEERLDGHNGLLLTPTADRLFDRGFLTFEDDGTPVWSSKISSEEIIRLNFQPSDVLSKKFHARQKPYLAYHRANVFKR